MRLIDAEKLIHELSKSKVLMIVDDESNYNYMRQRDVFKIVDSIPTIEERKKGKWIDDGKGLYMCSSCGKLWVHWWARIVPPKQMCKELRYCPMCGAEMENKNDT